MTPTSCLRSVARRASSRRFGRALVGSLAVALLAVLLAACATPDRRVPPPPPAPHAPETTIALLGATGMVGGYILDQALAQGYRVRALARTPAKLAAYQDRIAIVPGDAREPATLRELLSGSDLVISALGPVRADGEAAKMISTVVSGHLIRVMEELAIDRYIVISGGAVNLPGDERNLKGRTIRKLAELAYPDTVKDKQAEYALLAASHLRWTVVRCPLIDPEPFQHDALASLVTPPSYHLRAGELARFVLEQIDRSDYVRKGPFLGSR